MGGENVSGGLGWLVSGVASFTRVPQLVKIIRNESVEGIEPSLFEVRRHYKRISTEST